MANVHIIWTAGAGATSQDVQYKLTSSPTWITHSNVGGSVNSADINGLTDSTSYDFRIVTNCPLSLSPIPSDPFTLDTTPPTCNAPTGVSAALT